MRLTPDCSMTSLMGASALSTAQMKLAGSPLSEVRAPSAFPPIQLSYTLGMSRLAAWLVSSISRWAAPQHPNARWMRRFFRVSYRSAGQIS